MVNEHDRRLLRELARRVAEIAALPLMAERQALWRRHNALQPGRPLILIFPEGAWGELVPESALRCEGEAARRMERELRQRIYQFEGFDADNVVTAEWTVAKAIHTTGWGLPTNRVHSGVDRGAWAFDPVLHRPSDLQRITLPRVSHDEEESARRLVAAQELFGDILDVRLRGVSHISFHFMNLYTGWRGLEQVYLDMYAEPNMLHEAMSILEAGYRGLIDQYVEQNLLSLNHDNTYHSSGGNGWLDAPPSGRTDPERVLPADLWASAESQEMDPVSPEFHRTFVMEYEKRLLEPFGLTGYGCCEGLHNKIDDVLTIPGIRRVSMSPFCDVDRAAPRVGNRFIFSWKPQPAHLVGRFNPDLIRGYLQHTLDLCRDHGCVLEIILKDTHTCEHHPERFTAWSRIARELVEA